MKGIKIVFGVLVAGSWAYGSIDLLRQDGRVHNLYSDRLMALLRALPSRLEQGRAVNLIVPESQYEIYRDDFLKLAFESCLSTIRVSVLSPKKRNLHPERMNVFFLLSMESFP